MFKKKPVPLPVTKKDIELEKALSRMEKANERFQADIEDFVKKFRSKEWRDV